MNFESPIWLYAAALAIPAILAVYWLSARNRKRSLSKFVSAKLLPDLSRTRSPMKSALKNAAFLLGVAALMIALARPQYGYRWEESRTKGVDVIFAIDVSKSMLAEDMAPNRLERAKLAVIDISEMLKSDRVGIVAFSGQAFLQCPLTLDYDAFRMSLDVLDTSVIQRGGTNIAAAIAEAQTAFARSSGRKILVLISDGEELESSALEKARQAAEQGIVIYTLGVGDPRGQNITITENGRPEKLRDANGALVTSKLNENLLQEVAKASGGFYNRLSPEGIEAIIKDGIDKGPRSEISSRMKRTAIERFQIPLAIAIVLLALETLIGTRRFFTRGALPAAILLAALAPQGNVRADEKQASDGPAITAEATVPKASEADSPAKDAPNAVQSESEGAKKTTVKLEEEKQPTPKSLFNDGVQSYNDAKYEDSQRLFEDSMKLDPADFDLHCKAIYNTANAKYKTAIDPLLQAPSPDEIGAAIMQTNAASQAAAAQGAQLLKQGLPLLQQEKQMLSQAKDEKQKAQAMEKSPLKNQQFQQALKQTIQQCQAVEKAPEEVSKSIQQGQSAWKQAKEIVDESADLYADALSLNPQFKDAAQNENTARNTSKNLEKRLNAFGELQRQNDDLKQAAQNLQKLRKELEKLVRDDNQQNQQNQQNNQNQQNQNKQNQQNNQNQNQQNQNQQNNQNQDQKNQQNQSQQNQQNQSDRNQQNQNNQQNKDQQKQDQQNRQDKQNQGQKDQQNKQDKQNNQDKGSQDRKDSSKRDDRQQKAQDQRKDKQDKDAKNDDGGSERKNADKNRGDDGEQKDEQAVENKEKQKESGAPEQERENADKKPSGALGELPKQQEQAKAQEAAAREREEENFRKAAGVMTKAEAKQLLESMKDGEKILPLRGFGEQKQRYEKSYKDW